MLISIIIPCYNEEESLSQLFIEIDNMLAVNNFEAEVLLIDDGSFDNTKQIIEEKVSESNGVYRAIIFRRNHGQTAAMLAGMDHACGEVFVPLDADLQNPPSEIPKLLAKLDEGFDVVSGWCASA